MDKIRCIIKGDKFQAAKAAADRGIPFVFDHELPGPVVSETRGDVPSSYHDKVAEWYCEDSYHQMGGYPIGTLLFYSSMDVEEEEESY